MDVKHVLPFLVVMGIASSAGAETSKTAVVGWTGTGQEIVTRVERFGEVMVEDVAQEYWFTVTQTLRARDAGILQTYRQGEPSGAAEHVEVWRDAKPSEHAAMYFENAGIVEAVESDVTPDARRALVTTSRARLAPRDENWQCTTESRVLLFDAVSQEVWVVAQNARSGEVAPTQTEARCPQVTFRKWWHPDASRWLVEQTTDGVSEWLPGLATQAAEFATAPFRPADFAARVVAKHVGDGPQKSAWALAFAGEPSRALSALADDTGPQKPFVSGLLMALSGNLEGAKAVAKDAAKLAKTAELEGLLGVLYVATGDTKRATKSLNAVIKRASGYEELARLGALLSLVDLELSNQLYIHALSHPKAAEGDTAIIYAALIHGLLEVGENEAASELLGKVSKDDGLFKLLQARLALMTGGVREARGIVDDVLFTEPGRCMAYGTAAKLAVLAGDTSEALENYRAASICAPNDLEARYFVADLEARRGDFVAAQRATDGFLRAATPRKNDLIRDARRKVMEAAHARYSRQGVVLLNVSCRSGMCQGQAYNSTASPIQNVGVAGLSDDKTPVVVGQATIEELPAHTARPFLVRVSATPALVTLGRDDAEMQSNLTAPTP